MIVDFQLEQKDIVSTFRFLSLLVSCECNLHRFRVATSWKPENLVVAIEEPPRLFSRSLFFEPPRNKTNLRRSIEIMLPRFSVWILLLAFNLTFALIDAETKVFTFSVRFEKEGDKNSTATVHLRTTEYFQLTSWPEWKQYNVTDLKWDGFYQESFPLQTSIRVPGRQVEGAKKVLISRGFTEHVSAPGKKSLVKRGSADANLSVSPIPSPVREYEAGDGEPNEDNTYDFDSVPLRGFSSQLNPDGWLQFHLFLNTMDDLDEWDELKSLTYAWNGVYMKTYPASTYLYVKDEYGQNTVEKVRQILLSRGLVEQQPQQSANAPAKPAQS